MSVSIDYFFNSEKSFEQLVKELNALLGFNLTFSETDEEIAGERLFAMPLDFCTQTLENNGDLNFQDYKYQIGFTTYWGSADLRDIQVSMISFIAKFLYLRLEISEGMLVYDGQRLLARYVEKFNPETQGNDFFDIVSNKFVEFPKHLIDLDRLAWQ